MCDSNRCGCQLSSFSCELDSNNTDLYLKPGNEPPTEWHNSILNSSLLYDALINTSNAIDWQPEIGNGYVGSIVNEGSMFISGLFNGACGDIHKARMPGTLKVTLNNYTEIINGLDLKRAIFIKRWQLNNTNDVIIEQKFLAHRKYRNILLMQLSLIKNANNETITVNLNDNFKLSGGDFEFTIVSHGNYTLNEPMIYTGKITKMNDEGEIFNITVIKDVTPKQITFKSNNNNMYTFITSVITSMPDDMALNTSAMNEYQNAKLLIKNNSAIYQHEHEWKLLYESGIDIWPYPNTENEDAIIRLNGIGMNFNTANSISNHINSSLYYLYSSVRSDWNQGASPGGVATGMYKGAIFFDMDWYLTPAFLLLHPNLSNSLLKYRYNSINTSLKIAQIFGYNGTMYPFPSTYNGYAVGCCNGTDGSKVNCYEQHLTGDIGIVTWYYYLLTTNITWLKLIGYPILSGISDWVISRVTPLPNINDNGIKYNINSLIPVDEWCDGSGCGCSHHEIQNDAQMNAVCKLTLKYTVLAAKILNISNKNIALYQKVYENIAILFNDTYNRHNQFNSSECPNGFGGSHYTGAHTVCPEDILYLSYPLNPYDLNISLTVIKNDYDFFVPRTCEANAGMTTPIHTIVQTMLISDGIGDINMMEHEFNRSMYGACYGSYNVRNEIDKHPNILVHNDKNNTHFLTGDGGFIQQFIYGFSGIKIVENGLKLQKPYLPQNVYKMRLRKLFWRNYYLNLHFVSNQSLQIE
eukprot:158765_1